MTRGARGRRAATTLALAAGLWWGGAELVQWRASKRPPGRPDDGQGLLGALVLGYPGDPSGRPSVEQLWRCGVLMRTVSPRRGPVRVVFSGGHTTPAPVSEAASMAELCTRRFGLDPAVVTLEERATSTTENIRFGLPLLAGCDRIAIVSNPLHAARGRRDVAEEFPDLVPRLVLADDYRLGEHLWHKPKFTWHESAVGLWYWWHERGSRGGPGRPRGVPAQ